MNIIEDIETLIKAKIQSVCVVLPTTLASSTFFLFGYIFSPVTISQKTIQALTAALIYLLSMTCLLVAYILLLKKQPPRSPSFIGFTHNTDGAFWVNESTGQKICEACKAENNLTPLSRFGVGWKCPIHNVVVGAINRRTPIIVDD